MILNADGGCWPNPGPGRIGVVVRQDGFVIDRISQPIGSATSNIAEWRAAMKALDYAIGLTLFAPQPVELRMDSKLVVNQLTGKWRVKNEGLAPLVHEGRRLLATLREQGCSARVHWVPRSHNADADALT